MKRQQVRRVGIQTAIGVVLAIEFRQLEERRGGRRGQGHVHHLVLPVARPLLLVPGLKDLRPAARDIDRRNADGVLGVVQGGILGDEARDHVPQGL